MTANETFNRIFEIVEENERHGKITFMTECGLMQMPIERFCRQSADGLLYDLNRDESTTLCLGAEGLERWVNDYAAAKVIRYLINELEKARKK